MKLGPRRSAKKPNTNRKLDEHMIREGIVCNEQIISDGKLHTFHIAGDDENSRNGWYVAYNTEVYAVTFGSFKTGQKAQFSYVPADKLLPFELTAYEAYMEQAERQYQIALKAWEQEQIDVSLLILQNSEAVDPDHAFLVARKIGPHHMQQQDSNLLAPICLDAKPVNVLMVSPNGSRCLMVKTSLAGAYSLFGEITNDILVVCIDIESAASINETNGLPVAAAIKQDNLRDCVKHLKERYPNHRLVVAAINDELKDGSPLRTLAREVAEEFDAALAVPIFEVQHLKVIESPKTFNDLHRLHESDSIVQSIKGAKTLRETIEFLSSMESPDELDRTLAIEADYWGTSPEALKYRVRQHRKYDSYQRLLEMGGSLPLTQTEPWFTSVEIYPIAETIRNYFSRHAALPPGADIFLTLWVISTYLHDYFPFSAICVLTSAIPGCGKSEVMRLLKGTCADAIDLFNITPAALIRSIEAIKAAYLLDEGDASLPQNHEYRKIINACVSQFGANSVTCASNGSDYFPKMHNTWTAMAISMIDAYSNLYKTALSRSIVVFMEPMSPEEEELRQRVPNDFSDQCIGLRRKLMRWALDNAQILIDLLNGFEPKVAGLNNRAREKWRSFLAIAELLGGEYPALTLKAIEHLEKFDIDNEDLKRILLSDIKDVTKGFPHEVIRSQELVELLLGLEGRPWSELPDSGRKLSSTRMANMLKGFRIKPDQGRRQGERNLRGYLMADLRKAFERYLPPTQSTTPNTSHKATEKPNPLAGVILLPKTGLPRYQPPTHS